jgi:hypothetical protein
VGAGHRVPRDHLVAFGDHVFDRNVQVRERAQQHGPHLPQRLRLGGASRHWRVEQHVRGDDRVDCLRDDLRVAGVHRVMEVLVRQPCAHYRAGDPAGRGVAGSPA